MNRMTQAALILLAAAAALSTPAHAATNPVGEQISAAAASPAARLSMNEAALSGESSADEPAARIRLAGKGKRKGRSRRVRSVQGPAKMAVGNNSANAPAPLDCSIESHPDCQPKPAVPYHEHIGNFNFQLEIGG